MLRTFNCGVGFCFNCKKKKFKRKSEVTFQRVLHPMK